jgi:hypothetical protein
VPATLTSTGQPLLAFPRPNCKILLFKKYIYKNIEKGRHTSGNTFSYADWQGCLAANSVELNLMDNDATYEPRVTDIWRHYETRAL